MISRARDVWVLVATIVGSSLVFIDGAVVALALPAIQRRFHASAGDIAWIVELYTLVLGSLMLLGGALADRYGRKRAFVGGTALFILGSLGCALSPSIHWMLAARTLQGVGGMLLAPASLAMLGAHFGGAARGRAIAAWSAFGALTSTLGPMLGGALIDAFGWPAVFLINVPLGIVVILAAQRHVEESRDESAPAHIDVAGAALATLGLGAITYALLLASTRGWAHLTTGGAFAVGVLLLVAFVAREGRIRTPLVPPALFASRTFGTINLGTLLLYGALAALFYELPLVMIQAHGYTALQTALATLPMLAGIVLLARVGTALARRIGVRATLALGPAIVACGFAAIGVLEPARSYLVAFLPGIALVGVGMGITVAPLTASVIDAADPRHVGVASGINNAISRVAGLLAIAALTFLLSARYDASLHRQLDAMRATSAQRAVAAEQRDRLGGARFADAALSRASLHAFEDGFRTVALACALLALLAAIADGLGIDDAALRNA